MTSAQAYGRAASPARPMPACGSNRATSTTGCTSRLHERNGDWQPNANQRLQLIDEKDVDAAAGKSAQVECPVQWGSCRVEGV